VPGIVVVALGDPSVPVTCWASAAGTPAPDKSPAASKMVFLMLAMKGPLREWRGRGMPAA
jgi:hypothetical protein